MEIPGINYTQPQTRSRSPSPERQSEDSTEVIRSQFAEVSKIRDHSYVVIDIDEADDVPSVEPVHDTTIRSVDLEEDHPAPAPVQQFRAPPSPPPTPPLHAPSVRSIWIRPPHSVGLWISRGMM